MDYAYSNSGWAAAGQRLRPRQDWRSLHFIPRSSEDDHDDVSPPCFSGCLPTSACSCSYDLPLQCTVRKCLLGGDSGEGPEEARRGDIYFTNDPRWIFHGT